MSEGRITYDIKKFALMLMGFCYNGEGRGKNKLNFLDWWFFIWQHDMLWEWMSVPQAQKPYCNAC